MANDDNRPSETTARPNWAGAAMGAGHDWRGSGATAMSGSAKVEPVGIFKGLLCWFCFLLKIV